MKIDLFVRAVREPEKIIKKVRKGQQRYISLMRGGGTPKDDKLKLVTFVEPMDLVNDSTFYLFLINSFRASEGSKLRIYLSKTYGSDNIAWRYRAGM
jgi:hypothetical protein